MLTKRTMALSIWTTALAMALMLGLPTLPAFGAKAIADLSSCLEFREASYCHREFGGGPRASKTRRTSQRSRSPAVSAADSRREMREIDRACKRYRGHGPGCD